MKTLIILRHGKAELRRPDSDDYDRALIERGRRNSLDIGRFICGTALGSVHCVSVQ